MYKLGIRDNVPRPNVLVPSFIDRLPGARTPINYREPITGDSHYRPALHRPTFADRMKPKPYGNLESGLDARRDEELNKMSAMSREWLANHIMTKRNLPAKPTGETKVEEILNPR
jgi:hypothetical protein